jgi:hypothetical protein
MTLRVCVLAAALVASFAPVASADCYSRALISKRNGVTYINLPDPLHRCAWIEIPLPAPPPF